MRGSTRSSAKIVWPATLAAASTFTSERPMTLSVSSATHRLRLGYGREGFPAHPGGRSLDGLEDLQVPRAAAEVPGERLRDLRAGRRRLLGEERLRGEEEPGRAVPALGGAELGEGLPQGMRA